MSLGKTIIIMIVGKIEIRNDERCYVRLFLYDIFTDNVENRKG
jgi:hypothetical protein